MEERTFSHRSKQDLADLRDSLGTLTQAQQTLAAVLAVQAGLMLSPGTKLGLRITALRHGSEKAGSVLALAMSRSFPTAGRQLWAATMAHMVDGRDTYDAMSAGGWNKRELDTFLLIVRSLGWKPPEPEPQPSRAP